MQSRTKRFMQASNSFYSLRKMSNADFSFMSKELGLKIPKVLNKDVIYPELKRKQKYYRFDFCFDNEYQYQSNLDGRYYRYLKKYIGLDSMHLFSEKNPKLSFVTIIFIGEIESYYGFCAGLLSKYSYLTLDELDDIFNCDRYCEIGIGRETLEILQKRQISRFAAEKEIHSRTTGYTADHFYLVDDKDQFEEGLSVLLKLRICEPHSILGRNLVEIETKCSAYWYYFDC